MSLELIQRSLLVVVVDRDHRLVVLTLEEQVQDPSLVVEGFPLARQEVDRTDTVDGADTVVPVACRVDWD